LLPIAADTVTRPTGTAGLHYTYHTAHNCSHKCP